MKNVKRFLGLTLAVVLAFTANPVSVSAKEIIKTMEITGEEKVVNSEKVVYEGENDFEMSKLVRGSTITAASLRITPRTSEILIEFVTGCNFVASKVGVKNVYVQEKVWYGWKTIAQAASYDANVTSYAGQCKCTNATKGKTYRVLCTHYAIDSNGTEHVVANQSEEFVYN